MTDFICRGCERTFSVYRAKKGYRSYCCLMCRLAHYKSKDYMKDLAAKVEKEIRECAEIVPCQCCGRSFKDGKIIEKVQACRFCGCTDDRACPGGCSWVDSMLCSQCIHKVEKS